ncbi:hypothetical protein KCW85_12780, partial [Staphylococcus aureus]|uniref:hypothetical protein n=1 Tax=Staphylococcus aureus TaxID=1280 RepID=UPI0004F29DC9|nr:hypothetical protein [Staphylococcus aureus]MBS3411405.1 hypothetical protein [Staphylococcus aureus]MBS3603311.1 hypothetical protein [Staphylococcus aureus]
MTQAHQMRRFIKEIYNSRRYNKRGWDIKFLGNVKRGWDIKFLGNVKKLISINYLIEISFF